MKITLVAITLFFTGTLLSIAQTTNTNEVSRIARRINDFDIYETPNQKAVDTIVSSEPVEEEIREEIQQEIVEEAPKKVILSRLESTLNDGSYYTVQVAACREPLSQEYLDYHSYVEIYGSDGWYRYFSSRFLSLSEARVYMYEVRNTTKFKDAFPVRLKDFVKVDLTTGLRLGL